MAQSSMQKLLLMRMQFAWLAFYSLSALASSMLTALAGTQWNETDGQTKLMICIGVLGSWCTTLMALFSKAMARVSNGELPFIEGPPPPGTVERTVTNQVKTTTIPPAPETPPTT